MIMKSRYISMLILASFFIFTHKLQAQDVELEILPDQISNISRVLVQFGDPLLQDISAVREGQQYSANVSVESWDLNADLVARQVDGDSRPLYLRLRKFQQGQTQYLEIFSDSVETNLNSIRELQVKFDIADELSLLDVYFKAREICKHWQVRDREHTAGIQSCKLWFDASVKLAENPDWPYRMDNSVIEVMKKYEVDARSNVGLRERFRNKVSHNYIDTALVRLTAIQFQDARYVRTLINAGRLDDARLLNDYLIDSWDLLGAQGKINVRAVHRVDLDLLVKNRRLIETKFSELDR